MGRTVTVPIDIGRGTGSTLQEEIYASIRRSIVGGMLGATRRLPSTRALAAELGVSRTTVLLAVEHLQAEGYLVSRRGSGTFVAEDLPKDFSSASRHRAEKQASERHASRGVPPVHPPFSARGCALAQGTRPDRRGPEPTRAFRLGTPAIDLFPLRLWSKITQQCVRSINTSQLDYSALHGLPQLREAIAEQVRSRGTSCDPMQISVMAGAQRALDLVFHLLLDPGDAVWMEDPGYPCARGALASASAKVIPVPVDSEGMEISHEMPTPRNGHGADNARLAYVTPSHQFPLGVAMSVKRRRALLGWASHSQAWIVEDDYDCDFRYLGQPLPCLHGLDADGRVIYVGSFSKTLFPALRMGFLIAPCDLSDSVAAARLASDLHPPLLEQAVVAEFMMRGYYQRHLRRMRMAYLERLDALQRAVQGSGIPLRLRPVHTGLHAIADLDGVDAERVFREAALRAIEVMPLSHYYVGSGPRQNALLLGFASVTPAVIRAGVERLALAIEAAARRSPTGSTS